MHCKTNRDYVCNFVDNRTKLIGAAGVVLLSNLALLLITTNALESIDAMVRLESCGEAM